MTGTCVQVAFPGHHHRSVFPKVQFLFLQLQKLRKALLTSLHFLPTHTAISLFVKERCWFLWNIPHDSLPLELRKNLILENSNATKNLHPSCLCFCALVQLEHTVPGGPTDVQPGRLVRSKDTSHWFLQPNIPKSYDAREVSCPLGVSHWGCWGTLVWHLNNVTGILKIIGFKRSSRTLATILARNWGCKTS